MLHRATLVAFALLLTGCSGVSIETDEGDHALPLTVERIVVVPEDSWARTDVDAADFLKKVVAKLRARAGARDYGVAFELAADPPELARLAPDKDAVWFVSRCDYDPHSFVRRSSFESEGLPEIDSADEARGHSDDAARGGFGARAFRFSLRGFIRTPVAPGNPRAPENATMHNISRIAISGDASFDDAIGNEDETLWHADALAKIADSILDHLPRRAGARLEEVPIDGDFPAKADSESHERFNRYELPTGDEGERKHGVEPPPADPQSEK